MSNDWMPTPAEELAESKMIRRRAFKCLAGQRSHLPRLTKKQTEIIVSMMVVAFYAGEREEAQRGDWRWEDEELRSWERRQQEACDAARSASRKGVIARRKKSKRPVIASIIKAAITAGKEWNAKQLANQYGVGIDTVYRARDMAVGKRSTGSRRRGPGPG